MIPDTYIAFDQVSVAYGDEVIFRNLSFTVHDGEFLCLLGPSGCGKSTTLRLMSGLLEPDAGTIRVGGRAPQAAYQDFAFVFQSPRLVTWRNATQNVTLASELRFGGRKKIAQEARAIELLKLVGLTRDVNKRAGDLSGGERQRVAIARALHVDPRTILMDEPFSALDVRTRESMRREIITLWQREKKTVVFVTHDVEEALFLADRIIVFSKKPTRVLETVTIEAPRFRDLEQDPEIQSLRRKLFYMLREGESQ